MTWLIQFLKSSIGSKALMALTGAGLLAFTIIHMLGNWLVFAGPDALNEYAHSLKHTPTILWGARMGLLGTVALHVVMAFRLWAANQAARPIGYAYQNTRQATPTSRSMIYSGLLLLLFITYHLLHFTIGAGGADKFAGDNLVALAGATGVQTPDVYMMVIGEFQQPLVALSYIAAMLVLGSHLSHGIASLFQSLGVATPKLRPLLKHASLGLAALLVLGNISMPVAVLLGIIGK